MLTTRAWLIVGSEIFQYDGVFKTYTSVPAVALFYVISLAILQTEAGADDTSALARAQGRIWM